MNITIQRLCILAAPIATLVYLLAFVGVAGFVPPTEPLLGQEGLLAFYNENRNGIRAGQLIGMIASVLYLPWYALIAVHLSRIEGRYPVLSLTQFAGGLILVVYFLACGMLWNIAAYRPGLSGESLELVHDASWLTFVMVYPEYTLQLFCIGVVGLLDKRPQPLLPRWVCYFNFWVGLSAIGGGFATFFKVGPFAYNGILGFWCPVFFFLLWLAIMVPMMWKGVSRVLEAESARVDTQPGCMAH